MLPADPVRTTIPIDPAPRAPYLRAMARPPLLQLNDIRLGYGGNPVFAGQYPPEVEAKRVKGRGKIMPDQSWQPLATEVLPAMAEQYCSKIVAGVDAKAWRDRVMPLWPPSRPMEWMKDVEWLAPLKERTNDDPNHNLGLGNAMSSHPTTSAARTNTNRWE